VSLTRRARRFLDRVFRITALLLAWSVPALADDGCIISSPVKIDRINGQTAGPVVESMQLHRLSIRDPRRTKRRKLRLEASVSLEEVNPGTMMTAGAAVVVVNPHTCEQVIWSLPASGWSSFRNDDRGHDMLVYRGEQIGGQPLMLVDMDITSGSLFVTANGVFMDYALRRLPVQGNVHVLFVSGDASRAQFIMFAVCSAPTIDRPRRGRYVSRSAAMQCPKVTITDAYNPYPY
jgi:hypothetical protein